MRRLACAASAALLLAVASPARADVTEQDFSIDTFEDLIDLCGVEASDPNAVAAIHMCHGYLTGLVHFHIVMGRALENEIYCVKDEQRPTRDQFVSLLVEWSSAHPENDSLEAVDGVIMWAADTYPCSE